MFTTAQRRERRRVMPVKLTPADLETLHRAATLRKRFDAGIFPIGAGGHARFRKLERLGVSEFTGFGRDIDGEVDRDVPGYELTKAT